MSSQDTAGHQTIAQLLQQGLFHHRQGDIPTAMERYAEVLGKDPKNAEALYYVAVIACQENQFKQGVDLVRRAMSYSEPQARMFNVLGQALDRLGEPLEAIKALDEAIKLDPNLAAAHGNRANILVDAGMPGEALKSFNRALELIPDSIPDLLNRGALLAPAGRYEDALRDYDKVIALEPSNPEVHSNRANVLKDLGLFELGQGAADSPRFDEALASYNRAIKIQPGLHEAYLGRAMLQLARGDFAGGFADYEHRSEVGRPGFTPLAQPRWDGAPLNGERLVLLAEQGLGDTIQFCRFAPVLAAQGVEVTLLVKKAMAPLMRTVKGITVTGDISEVEADTRPFRWLPLMSAPHLLGTTLESLPHEIPYLSAEPARVKDWAGKLGDGKFKIGINWNPGNPDHTVTSRRDIPLAAFAELAALPGVELISLQKGPQVGQIAAVPFGGQIRQIDADMNAEADLFLDTAAVIQNLDLVIGCDTSVVHLAGALARPVFTAVPLISDWRWMLKRDDTPWYPSMRLFRQNASRDWGPVLARMVDTVRQMMAV
ncbi:MAG TPA: tetratricopeptide repeat-containing glycosyltransferase family protein [Pseudolabrys sp.]|nr:tetratricopeptide repeat-containing glycosyltransferase family protein [Pseudolabrys sp.]